LDKLGICRTDNIVIDSLVNAKYSLAKKENIKMNIDIKIPMQINMDYADLSIVVGNILDNAIEANLKIPSEKRFIDLFARVDKNLLIITIINAYDGILIKDKDGNVLSRKLDINNHGWGLISLKRVVEKYQGSYIIEDKEEIFSLKIMILLRNN
jgi:sensor histidine kinase regulating citrate/malate metabolism